VDVDLLHAVILAKLSPCGKPDVVSATTRAIRGGRDRADRAPVPRNWRVAGDLPARPAS
jgi:hypothetical protein